MSSTVTVQPTKGVRGIGMITVIAGIVMIVLGLGVWVVVSQTLSAEEITVSEDASMFAGQHVAGPFTAYAQAEVIDKHATEMAGGKTYAQLDQDDPVRDSVMDASFLRASLFTSVVAFGVCALVIGLGIMFILLGSALRKLAGGPQVVVDTPSLSSGGDLSHAAHRADRPAEPARPEPTTPTRTDAPAPPPERPSTRTAPETPAGGTPPPTSTTPSSTTPPTTPPSAPPTAPSTPPENPPATPPSSGSGSPSA